ncbi:MAG: phage tail tape measure protein, partial [Proteobacteria bacterium]
KRLESLAAELDVLEKLKIANEEEAKSSAYAANLKSANGTIKAGFDSDIAGAGLGDKARDRLRQDLAIQQDYNQQMVELQKQLNSGDISQELYNTETGMLKDALAERLELQQDYYSRLDEAQSDWLSGVSSAWENYRDMATDYQQQAANATYDILDGLTDSISDNLSAMILEGQTLGETFRNIASTMASSIINALTEMAAQWLVYQGVQLLVGKATQASAIPALIANATATSLQAQLAAFASTAAIPIVGPALAPAAAVSAAAATAPFVAGISSAALAGMAHDGIDSVPADGSWYLQKGERVTTAETSAKLDNTLERVRRGMRDTSGGGTTNNISISLPNATDARSGKEAGAAAARKLTRAVKAAGRYS